MINKNNKINKNSKCASDQNYYKESDSWYSEIYESVKCSRDRYRLIAYALCILMGLVIACIITMLPLKQYYYRLVLLDKSTGEVSVVKEMENKYLEEGWLTTRYFINQYILNRHLYSYEDITRCYNLVLAMSDRSVSSQYKNEIMDTNFKSPIKILGKDFYREVTNITINQLNNHSALVRFRVITRNRTNYDNFKIDNFQAVVKWEYKNISMDFKDRDKNPFGFFVTYYQESPVFAENQ